MNGHAFSCQMCGQCCVGEGGIAVPGRDRLRLAALLEISLREFESRYTENSRGTPQLITREDGSCVFFSPESGCLVHSAKPEICRAWPFFLGNLRDEASWRMAQDFCPGINPQVDHQEFVRQGLEYLRQEGLVCEELEEAAASLKNASLFREEPSG